jgi:glycosyltransferase involved in cell wall biosynthesis
MRRQLGTSSSVPTVIVFTTAFPLDPIVEVSFLRPELVKLRAHFERVIVVPSVRGEVQCALPDTGVEIDHRLAGSIHPSSSRDKSRMAVGAVRGRWLAREIARCPRLLLHPSALKRFTYCSAAAQRISVWLDGRLAGGEWHPQATVLYTYWLNYVTAGLGRGRRRFPDVRIVSRAHNTDIYEVRNRPPCYPLQPAAVEAADLVLADSEAGRDHLAARYPSHRHKMSMAPVGSPEPGFFSRPSSDGCFRIVSCSYLKTVKRVDLMVQALGALGSHCPDRDFEWHHLGGGPEHATLSEMARSLLPKNVRWTLHGPVSPERVLEFYRKHPVDLFLSTTSFEGRPVSMMEAMSCAIPIAATSVGGVPELVGADRGWLLPGHPSPEEVARLLASIASQESLDAYRSSARRFWETHLRADQNFEQFARMLRSMITLGSAEGDA